MQLEAILTQESASPQPVEMALEAQIRLADSQIAQAIERQKTGESALAWHKLKDKIDALHRSFSKEHRVESERLVAEFVALTTEQQLAVLAQRELTQLMNLRRQLVRDQVDLMKKRGQTMTLKQMTEKLAGIASILKDEIEDRQLLRSVLVRMKRYLNGNESAALPTKTDE